MATLNLDGDNLGEKHRLFNELIKQKVTDKNVELILTEDDNLQNLFTIEVAAANRNVDFILEMLKGEDMLYMSRALNRSTWLITENQYSHIINPQNLYSNLFPHMTAKAINKLQLSIRLNLKNESRVEQFYNYLIDNVEDREVAFKWLQHCSVPFIDNEIRKHCDEIPRKTMTRLYEKSFSLLETVLSVTKNDKTYMITSAELLACQYTEKYLDIIEKYDLTKYIMFKPKTTAHLMIKCPGRIIENFEKYYNAVDITTFVKYLRKTKKVEDFLLEQAKNDNIKLLYRDNYLGPLIKFIPRESRINFLKHIKSILKEVKDNSGYGMFYQSNLFYKLYKYASFDIAFNELKNCIRVESKPRNRNETLIVLLSTVSKNIENVRKLLQYYFNNHCNEPYQFKIEFLNAFLSETESFDFDDDMWNMLNKLFHSLETYTESDNNAQSCIQAIIVRNIVKRTKIPDIVQTKFVFDTLKSYEKKLKTQKDKDAVFSYLYHFVIDSINNNKLESDLDFSECVSDINKLLNLLMDWKKDIKQYPEIVSKIQQLIKTNNEKHYEADLTSFYKLNKKWRSTFFEESILLAPSDTTCMNVIKHDFSVLERNMEYLLKIFFNDKIPVTYTLKKLRIYWPAKAQELKDIYLSRTDSVDNFKALVTGLCVILPQKELKNFVEKFAPTNEKLDWNETEERVYFLRKNIAIRLHTARPLIPIEFILLYAKGDYLQYTVPSLSAILHQLSSTKSKRSIYKILDAPVSLQKFGIRYASRKLDTDDLTTVFLQIWKSTKNPTIRTVVLTNVHKRLCLEKDETKIKILWMILSNFIDDLTNEENGIIYSKLSGLRNIPMIIKVVYFEKVYKFLASLSQPKFNRDAMLMRMKDNSCDFMDKLDDQFVADYILNNIWDKIVKNEYFWNEERHFATYLLRNNDDETQLQRYKIFLNPLLEKCLLQWTEKHEGIFSVIEQTQKLLKELIRLFKSITIDNNMAVPLKLFQNIQTQLENDLSYEKNYKLLTYWKLAIEFTRLFDENKHMLNPNRDINDLCKEINTEIAPSFARYCVQIIKEDVNRFNSWIHKPFTSTLEDLFQDLQNVFVTTSNQLEYFKYMLECEQNREVYLTVIPLLERFYESCYDNKHNKPVEKSVLIEIQHLLYSYPTEEMKMHYYDLISNSQFLV